MSHRRHMNHHIKTKVVFHPNSEVVDLTDPRAMIEDRGNKATETLVKQMIAVAKLDGQEAGIQFAKDKGLPLELTRRVLLQPDKRRSTDWS